MRRILVRVLDTQRGTLAAWTPDVADPGARFTRRAAQVPRTGWSRADGGAIHVVVLPIAMTAPDACPPPQEPWVEGDGAEKESTTTVLHAGPWFDDSAAREPGDTRVRLPIEAAHRWEIEAAASPQGPRREPTGGIE